MNINFFLLITSAFILRVALCIQGFFFFTPASSGDADRYHSCGAYYAGHVTDSFTQMICDYYYYDSQLNNDLYVHFLKNLYLLFGNNVFVGNFSSTILWLISVILIYKILSKIRLKDNYKFIILIFFCFSPSSIIYTVVTLRESLQLFLITYSTYLLIYIFYFKEKIFFNFLLLVITIAILSQLHHWFFVVPFILIGLIFFYMVINLNKYLQLFIYIIFFTTSYIIIQEYDVLNSFTLIVTQYLEGSIGSSRNIYSTEVWALDRANMVLNNDGFYYARAQYLFESDICPNLMPGNFGNRTLNDIVNLSCENKEMPFLTLTLILFPKLFFNYFLAPFPFLTIVNLSISDYILFFENILRFSLICYFIKNFLLRRINKFYFFLFLFYLAIEVFFTVGTTNWGTASRHHIITYGLLCMISFFSIKNFKNIDEKNK